MASNLAIVAYDDPALEETLKGEGIVVPTGDIDGLYSALETLAFNPDVRSHYSARAAARSRIFTKDHMVERIIHVYEEMLTGQ
jgi:glycosyltransferase involved in cell wall biosynthesis